MSDPSTTSRFEFYFQVTGGPGGGGIRRNFSAGHGVERHHLANEPRIHVLQPLQLCKCPWSQRYQVVEASKFMVGSPPGMRRSALWAWHARSASVARRYQPTRQDVVVRCLAADEQLNRGIVQEPVFAWGLVDVEDGGSTCRRAAGGCSTHV
jgi:hypothetical protein